MPKRLPPSFAAPAQSTGFLLWQASNRWQRLQRAALADVGLTYVQFLVLAAATVLTATDTPVTQAQLARHTATDMMMTSQVLRVLQRKRLLKRVPHPVDTRANAVQPTVKGSRLARKTIWVVERIDAEFLSPVGGDAKALTSLLSRLAAG